MPGRQGGGASSSTLQAAISAEGITRGNADTSLLQQLEAALDRIAALEDDAGVTYPSISTFSDAFEGDLSAYTVVGSASIAADQLLLVPITVPGSYIERGFWSLPDAATIYITLDSASAGTTVFAGVELRSDANNTFELSVGNGTIRTRVNAAGTVTDADVGAWNDTSQRVLRIKRNGSNFEIHASSDGSTWGSALATVAIPGSFNKDRFTLRIRAAYWGTESSPAAVAISGANTFEAEPGGGGGGGGGAGGTPTGPITWDARADLLSVGNLPADTAAGVWNAVQRWSDYGVTNQSVAFAEVIASPVFAGHKAYKFTVNTGGQRSELAAWDTEDVVYRSGEEYWFGNVYYLPSNPNASLGWFSGSHHSLNQFHSAPSESGAMYLDIRDSDSRHGLGLERPGGWDSLITFASGLLYDRPLRIEQRIRFHNSTGQVETWFNNVLIHNLSNLQTLPPGDDRIYVKEGLYQSPEAGGNVVISHGWVRGSSRAAVQRG